MSGTRYSRLFADAQGASHFAEVAVEFEPIDVAPPAASLLVAGIGPAQSCAFICGLPDWDGRRPHPSPRRQLFCTLRGAYAVTASDGTVRCFPIGSVLLLEDTTGAGHMTGVLGDEAVLIVAVSLAEEDDL